MAVTRHELIAMLAREGAPEALQQHVQAVADHALRIAGAAARDGHAIDRELVEAAAILHDLGLLKRTGTPVTIPEYGEKASGVTSDDIAHGILGYRALCALGIDRKIARGALTHLFGPDNAACAVLGIAPAAEEAIATRIEERIVGYADLLVWVAMLGRNPWREGEEAILYGFLPYAGYFWRQATAAPLPRDHLWVQRVLEIDRQLRGYARPEDFGVP
jgi:predicted HD phosphohydrolase